MFILFLIVFIDVMAFGMIVPLLPYLKFIYNVTSEQVGYLISMFAVAALFGSIFWGVVSDRFGRKVFLVLPLLLSSVVYVFSAYTVVFWEIVILRMLSGFFTANFPVAFAAAADSTTQKTRFKAMATLGMAFSFGFVLGPTLGGYLAMDGGFFAGFDLISVNSGLHTIPSGESINLELPFLAAAILSLISGLLGVFFFKETLTKDEIKNSQKLNLIMQIKSIYSNKMVVFFSYLTIIISIVFAGIEVAVSLFLYDVFKFPVNYIGAYWAFFAIGIAISRFMSASLFAKPRLAILLGFFVISLGVFLLIFTSNIVMLTISTMLTSWGLGLVMTSVNARLSLEGTKNQQGTIFGINQLFGNLGRVIGPAIIPFIYAIHIDFSWLFLSILVASCFILSFTLIKKA